MDNKVRVVHYINQFFAQIGGEEKANIPPQIKEGPVGPGMLLQNSLADQVKDEYESYIDVCCCNGDLR